ncbi:DUF4367 domain-containing protein [Solibaculum mannosilyticum]|uniref:DUF4367 domain-containing protein n=1 Tax=Solibaculum mannosilyticum TaxID=2780922 RepID=UPI0007A85FAD|nr:hypothetical protein BN3661_00601 [Eubacteriaceae bacterium CHKCI005]
MREIEELKERIAILEALEKENQRILLEDQSLRDDSDYRPSAEAAEEFQKQLVRISRKKQRVHTVQVVARRVCFVMLAIMCVGVTVAFAVPEVRAQLTDLLIQITQNNNAVNLTHGVYLDWNDTHYPRYLPEGYEISGVSILEDVCQIEYRNANQTALYFLQQDQKTGGMTDGENLTNAEQVEVSGLIGYLTQKDDKYTLLWADERFIYTKYGRDHLREGNFFVIPPQTPYAGKSVQPNTRILFIKTRGDDKLLLPIEP